jgi:hypothetical protein
MIIGAACYGYTTTIQEHILELSSITPTSTSPDIMTRVATITFSSAAATPHNHSLIASLYARKTNRAEYDISQPVNQATIDEIRQIPPPPNTHVHLITDSVYRSHVAELQGQADAFVLNSPNFSRELGDWLLPNTTTADRGMPGFVFGFQNDQAQRLHTGLCQQGPLQPEDRLRMALGGKISLEKSPLIGFITVDLNTPPSWLHAGRYLEHILLILTRAGLSTALLAGICEVPLLQRIFQAHAQFKGTAVIIFRTGQAFRATDLDRPPSPRAPLHSVCVCN